MKDLAIYGAGGFGRETACLIQQINQSNDQWNLIGFFDDGVLKGKLVDSLPVLGGLAEINLNKKPLNLVIAVADPVVRKALVEKITQVQVHYPVLIHPDANAGSSTNTFGKGCIVTAGVIMTTGIKLQDFVILNLSSTIGHDVSLGSWSTVMPGCSISGNVRIGEGTMVGTGARILQNLSIGKHCRIGAGAVVTQNFTDSKTIVGVPAIEK